MTPKTLQLLSVSLQDTSFVLSKKGLHEQAMLQEAGIQLIGMALQSDVPPISIDETGQGDDYPAVVPENLSRAVKGLDVAVWVGSVTGHAILVKSVADASEWQELPLHLQNFVGEKSFPCHLLVFVEQLALDGDVQHRHYVESVFVILKHLDDGRLQSDTVFGNESLRKGDPEQTKREALAHIAPYLRIVLCAMSVKKAEEQV